MIENFNIKDDYKECSSTGCSCCYIEYNIDEDKEDIIDKARDNIRVVKKICKYYKIDLNDFIKQSPTPDECEKHEFVFAFQFDDRKTYRCKNCGEFKSE